VPDVMGGVQSGAGVSDLQGPDASLDYGQAGPVQQMANSLKNNAPQAYAAAQPPQPGQAPQGGAAPQGGNPSASPPVQPPPRQQATPDTVNAAFSPPQQVAYPYAMGWQVAAAHPRAGPYTQLMARLTKQGARPVGPASPQPNPQQ
jgi:hypothetical protein